MQPTITPERAFVDASELEPPAPPVANRAKTPTSRQRLRRLSFEGPEAEQPTNATPSPAAVSAGLVMRSPIAVMSERHGIVTDEPQLLKRTLERMRRQCPRGNDEV